MELNDHECEVVLAMRELRVLTDRINQGEDTDTMLHEHHRAQQWVEGLASFPFEGDESLDDMVDMLSGGDASDNMFPPLFPRRPRECCSVGRLPRSSNAHLLNRIRDSGGRRTFASTA